MSAQTTTVKLKLELRAEHVAHITEAMQGPNSASPAIDVHEAMQFVQKWAYVAPTSRSWLDTPAGIVITHCREGEYAPTLALWPALPDGLLAVGDCPIDGVTVTTYIRDISDLEALDALSEILTGARDVDTNEGVEGLLDTLVSLVARTGRAA